LLGGGIASTGLWVLLAQRPALSRMEVLPRIQARLATATLFFYFLLTTVVLYQVIFSDFILTGY
jgi:hypothetical protein